MFMFTDKVVFATSNVHKFEEARRVLGDIIIRKDFRCREIRAEDVAEVAEDAVRRAYAHFRTPVFVEDSGLFIKALNGFPGAYSKWVYEKVGCEGVLKLMIGIEDRTAYFRCAVAFFDGQSVSTFVGTCKGTISYAVRGEGGFAYDRIFIPDGFNKTFAEKIELKYVLSHRYKALMKLKEFLSGYYGKVAFKKER